MSAIYSFCGIGLNFHQPVHFYLRAYWIESEQMFKTRVCPAKSGMSGHSIKRWRVQMLFCYRSVFTGFPSPAAWRGGALLWACESACVLPFGVKASCGGAYPFMRGCLRRSVQVKRKDENSINYAMTVKLVIDCAEIYALQQSAFNLFVFQCS